MEQCCQPDIVEDHATLQRSPASGNEYYALGEEHRALQQSTASGNEEEDYYEGYTPDAEYYAAKAYEARRDARRAAVANGEVATEENQYEGYSLEYQVRAESTSYRAETEDPYWAHGDDGDGACYGRSDDYDSYSSDEEDEGSEKDYDSDFH